MFNQLALMCFSDLHKGFQGVYPPQAQLLWSFLPFAIGILLSQGAKPSKLGKMGGDRWFVHTWPWWWRSCWIWWIVLVYVRILSEAFKFNCHMIISSFAFFQAVGDGLFGGYHRTPSLRAYIVHRSVLEKSMTRLPNSLSVKAHVPPPGKSAQTVQSNFTTTCFFMFTLFHQEMIQRKWTYVSSKLKPLWVENTVVTPSELTTSYFWICLEHQSVEDPNLTHFH